MRVQGVAGWTLLDVETLAKFNGIKRVNTLLEAWKHLLFNLMNF